jgi:nucleoside-diphosphate-sugar epimerase
VLRAVTGASADAHFGGLPDRPEEQALAADTARAEHILGWRSSTSLEEGLMRTVASIGTEPRPVDRTS